MCQQRLLFFFGALAIIKSSAESAQINPDCVVDIRSLKASDCLGAHAMKDISDAETVIGDTTVSSSVSMVSKVAVFIRSAGETLPFFLIAQHMKQLPSNHDLWIIYDCTRLSAHDERLTRASVVRKLASLAAALSLPAPRLWMERDTVFRHGEQNYPLEWIERRKTPWIRNDNMGWWLHEPFIAAMWLHPAVAEHKYTFGWFLEDDVAFAGNIAPFYERMEARHPHFVTAVDGSKWSQETFANGGMVSVKSNRFFFSGIFTMAVIHSGTSWNEALQKIASTSPNQKITIVKSNEHIVGYSDRMLKEIDGLLRKGVWMYGEFFSATVCKNLPSWCSIEDLYSTNFVNKRFWGMGSYWSSCEIGTRHCVESQQASAKEENWWRFYRTGKNLEAIASEDKKASKNQWYHPLKYLKKKECGPASTCMERIREFL
jgi:hypothetical protein